MERREERMVEHLKNLLLGSRPAFLVPAHELLLVHDLGGEDRDFCAGVVGGGLRSLELGQVDGADVAGAEAEGESQIREGQRR
ncbi:hypothetical protein LINPERHAP2_LOCUS7422, partial [Linum perenne]